MTKRKPKKWNPGRLTIKGLQDRIKQLEQQVVHEQQNNNYHVTQRKHAEDRLKLVAAENESLLKDKTWLKQVIQSFLSNDPLPRIGTR